MIPVRVRIVTACALLMLVAPRARAATAFDFYDRGPYRAAVPRPAAVLGYEPGTFHTSFGNMERYIDALLAAAPDRVARETYGLTYEARERALLIVTSPANRARLAAIREATARLADPRRCATATEAEGMLRDLPVTVWLNYSIHGDESASFEAMAQVAYQLAAGEDAETMRILDSCVVILNLAHNPDGHERFVTWINALGKGDADPWAIEQQRQQPWGIGGRSNHYQFDLNRDALAMSQVESRQMGRVVRSWHPQVFADHHGQTSSFFFPPPSTPLNHVLDPGEVEPWYERFGRGNAAAFDRYGWNYYVRDVFDMYYPGYWDIWPTLNGAVGMTYETDGGGNLAIRRDDDTVVTLLDGIRRHFVASLATCSTASRHRAERLRDFWRFGVRTLDQARRGAVRAYAIDAAKDPVRAAALAENLLAAGVEVRWLAAPFTAPAARAVWADGAVPPRRTGDRPVANKPAGRPTAADSAALTRATTGMACDTPEPLVAAHAFPAGAFIVDLAQPGGRVARTLLERDATIDSVFARQQLEKYERNIARGRKARMEGYDFYDVTAWSLPITYGVDAYALRDLPPGGVALETPDPNASDDADDRVPDSLAVGIPYTARVSRTAPLVLRGAGGTAGVDLMGGVEGGRAGTAYVWSSAQEGSLRLALRLLQDGFRVAATTMPLQAATYGFPRGSFIARVERNLETLHGRIAEMARTSGVRVLALNTAYTESGDTGVGSETVVSLKRPRVAVLVDGPVSSGAYGVIWYLLERRIGLRFTALRAELVGGIDLDRYNVIVVPDGDGGALAGTLGDGGIARLKDWVSRGGTLVCLDDAAEFPTLKNVGLSTARAVGVITKPKKDDEEEAPADSASRVAETRPQYLPGTVFWARLDPRHFLSYGYDAPRIPVLMQGRLMLKPTRDGANVMTFDGGPLKLAGWSWPETAKRLQGTAYAVDEPIGRGHVILVDGPIAFRMFWRSSERLLLNAIAYGPALR